MYSKHKTNLIFAYFSPFITQEVEFTHLLRHRLKISECFSAVSIHSSAPKTAIGLETCYTLITLTSLVVTLLQVSPIRAETCDRIQLQYCTQISKHGLQ